MFRFSPLILLIWTFLFIDDNKVEGRSRWRRWSVFCVTQSESLKLLRNFFVRNKKRKQSCSFNIYFHTRLLLDTKLVGCFIHYKLFSRESNSINGPHLVLLNHTQSDQARIWIINIINIIISFIFRVE